MILLYKKTLLAGLLLVIGLSAVFAQKPLTLSKEQSQYTYIYKLTTANILNFYKHPDDKLNENILHHPVDSFKTSSYWENILPTGNYLKVSAEKNRLVYSFLENHSAVIKILHNNYDQRFVLVDKQGNNITDAVVSFNGKAVKYDDKSATWHTKSNKKENIVQADFGGVANFFIVKQEVYDRDDDKDHSWLSSLWSTIKKIFKKDESKRYNYKQKPKPYSGFIVFNKPKYKPNDTVKFKAFILNNKTKLPITQKKLTVKLIRNYDDEGVTIGAVNSYRNGGFEFSFALGDTLELDKTYNIALIDPDTKKNTDKKNGGYSLYNAPEIMLYSSFQYEEYELKSTIFNMRVDKKEQWRGSTLPVYLKATDENDLPIPDGRVKLTVTATNISFYKQKHVFVPNILWEHNLTLDPVGETKVLIPDSIFPKANINYRIEATFLNSNNEERTRNEYIKFNDDRFNIVTNLNNDTLNANYQEYGKEIKGAAIISALNADDDTISKLKVNLPSKILINPNAVKYNIETDSTDTELELKDFEGDLSINGERNADSLFVKVNNPRNLHFWYSVFAGNQLIDVGEANKLFYKKAYGQQKMVTFWINYIWGGVAKIAQVSLLYRKDQLTINVKQPVSVYPGQRVQTDIVVTNAAGKPVNNVDLTAWALTKKFENYRAPSLPYTGYNYSYRKTKKSYETDKTDAGNSLKLNRKRWSKEMGLDSIEYYKFTNPAKIYTIEEPGIDTITQIAPFVVKDGEIEPVHILYIDEKPVYFSQAQQMQRYSFAVKPGRHTLRFRTAHQSIKLDSVFVERSKKLILSINADAYPGKKVADTLDKYEADLINNYLITIIDNFDINQAIIKQNDRLFYINPVPRNGSHILTGPLADNNTMLYVKGEIPKQFVAEPNYSYLFEPGLLKQKSIAAKYPFNTKISVSRGISDYTQYVLTQHAADSLWQNYLDNRSNTTQLFNNDKTLSDETGRLKFEREILKDEKPALLKNIIIYKYNEPDFIRIFPGNSTDLGYLDKGKYRMLFLLQGDRYDVVENINIKPNGLNYYKFHIIPTHQRDSVSIKISDVINNRSGRYNYKDISIENDALKIKEAFNEKYTQPNDFTGIMTGRVFDKGEKSPLVGVSIRVKGTTKGAVTDINGSFTIKVPPFGKLLFNYIGFESKEVSIKPGTAIKVTLNLSSKQLQDVVVIGYGIQRKQSLTGSVSVVTSLNGMVAGLQVIDDYGDQANLKGIQIRGISTLPGQTPLYIVDGNVVESLTGINAANIGDINILKSSAAVALYGARAANGVVIINTKKNTDQPQTSQLNPGDGEEILRRNFSDYAYWWPKLTTDAEGKASFTTIFPDDITNWRTFIMAINGERQTGYKEGQIKSFKPISANFIAPQFAVAGDEMKLIGKVVNYNTDAVNLTRTFTFNGKPVKQNTITVTNSKIDTLSITAGATDSLSFEYTIKRDNGYFDGERRKIPVIKQGIEETKGVFEALNSDTSVTFKFDPAMGPVTFRAEASVLPTLIEETSKLREYKYLCNEQLASKLKGLLAEQRIKKFLGEDFKYGKNIREVIKKLQENRKANGTWGWWKDTDEELWISLHAVEALLNAQKEGYMIQLDKQKLTEYLIYQLESYKGADKLTCLELLHQLDAKVDYQKYIDVVEKENKTLKQKTGIRLSTYDKFRMILVKQETGLPVRLDSLYATERRTLFGNCYWGNDNYSFFDNSIQLSVMAYRIIKADDKRPELLRKIRGYFLEQREHGGWRNTYESALILETMLPDLLTTDKQVKAPVITIKGVTTETISKFPYTATLAPQDVKISKTGSLPVYITGSQQFWNAKPEKVSKDFTVNTWFEKDNKAIANLKGGIPVLLKAEITAKGDADFVMIEIPIPAGCSYQTKEQSWSNNEVHREYFKEKVSIFCRKLKEGKYTFTVNLIPRYDGNYHLNPAKAEMMYFPVFYGREAMKSVVIGE
ncbi:carboxypeptidase-like regulatory domain-containing protein [Mucilaginibacter sp. FT3.2]|uniref:carboxypeptidase-like regulatory domain-containing protein n=1 Tax=Mucilaginibacter sp. FT3.2 TaxID=2723090 RepID=UPI00160F415C|nr:carboxypeptidase-like regulatory domain-containing protein [Mucilaginibacter sp. FT3.2]MBB6234857.1 TonB-dependent SusC/RagA subfamily outer membrane receptor [Mucilaginibacter sp. FT3.2]